MAQRCIWLTYRVTVVEWVTELLQSVEEPHVVFGFIGCVCDATVQFLPSLKSGDKQKKSQHIKKSLTCGGTLLAWR